jgi:hypothetical protein
MVDAATKFHNYMFVSGWFHPNKGRLLGLSVSTTENNSVLSQRVETGIDHGGVMAALGGRLGFKLQLLLEFPYNFDDDLLISCKTNKETSQVKLSELITDRLSRYESYSTAQEFHDEIRGNSQAKVLDIGGRSRSMVDRSKFFPGTDYTVLDIVPGDNVDVVGDAHKISSHFPVDTFDYVVSTSVFEHLSMPWKAAVEMNKVLKLGGKAMVQTHQSLGMHDLPWDFFRFSDTSWDGIFNEKTGFKVLKRVIDHENFILPFLLRPSMTNAESSAGFEVSLVIVQKISNTNLVWDVDPDEVIPGSYPVAKDEKYS